MLSARVLVLLVSCLTVFCEDSFLSPCDITDTECLRKSTQTFLAKTAAGVPEYDIKAIDPLIIPSLDILFNEELGMSNHYKNLTVVGLKNQQLSSFSLNKETKAVELQTKVNLVISGDITLEAKKKEKSLPGTISIKGSALCTAKYNYNFQTDDKGVSHFVLGPEIITCDPIGDPDLQLNPELVKDIKEATDLKEEKVYWGSHREENYKKIFCSIVGEAYVTVVHNIRAAAKVLPKEAFLKDL
ncbi:juvenile hormone-binding protein-like [Zerene cesonia]|uniref:juvenile hormone-binding protein-like n=1 Tax=Zerene cesonia TaxID=33412 RepID=UPI0018E593DA|nr:juvenile hormone-binding protein-like [Zerene cesonia]